jgi:hypothetical protein
VQVKQTFPRSFASRGISECFLLLFSKRGYIQGTSLRYSTFTRKGKEEIFYCSLRGMHSLNKIEVENAVQLEPNIVFLEVAPLDE